MAWGDSFRKPAISPAWSSGQHCVDGVYGIAKARVDKVVSRLSCANTPAGWMWKGLETWSLGVHLAQTRNQRSKRAVHLTRACGAAGHEQRCAEHCVHHGTCIAECLVPRAQGSLPLHRRRQLRTLLLEQRDLKHQPCTHQPAANEWREHFTSFCSKNHPRAEFKEERTSR